MAQNSSRKRMSKKEASLKIENFFKKLDAKSPKEIKKIKRFAMKHSIKLKEKRKYFCKKCLAIYKNPRIRIKNNIKSMECENCGYVSRWKIKK